MIPLSAAVNAISRTIDSTINWVDGGINSSIMVSCITVNLDYGHVKLDIIAIKFHHHQSLIVPCKPKMFSVTMSSFPNLAPQRGIGGCWLRLWEAGS